MAQAAAGQWRVDGTPDWAIEDLLAEDFALRYGDSDGADPDAWKRSGSCSQTDPEAFFPEKGGSIRKGKKVCQGDDVSGGCPVRAECLAYALRKRERFGIWGGFSERERRRMYGKSNEPGERMYAELENEVLARCAAGGADRDVAAALQVSVQFVKRSRARARA